MRGLPVLDGVGARSVIAFNPANNRYSLGASTYSTPSSIPGWSFTRASTGYALNSAGTLVSFASGTPRITDLGFLSEQSATNSFLQSRTFDNPTWTKTNATVTPDVVAAPDGTITADKLVASVGSAQHYVLQSVSGLTASEARTVSVYAKYGGVQYLLMYMSQGPVQAWFDLQAGTVSNITGSATITALANGWYRCSIINTSAGGISDNYELHTATTAGGSTHNGDGVNGIYLWEANLQRGVIAPSSPILTTSSTATRAADVASISSLVLPSAGTWLAQYVPSNFTGNRRIISGPASGNFTTPLLMSGTSGAISAYDSAPISITANTGTLNALNKGAMSYDANGTSVVLNGGTVATGLAGTFSNLTTIYLGNDNSGSVGDVLNGYLQQVILYPSRLSNSQLQALTQ